MRDQVAIAVQAVLLKVEVNFQRGMAGLSCAGGASDADGCLLHGVPATGAAESSNA